MPADRTWTPAELEAVNDEIVNCFDLDVNQPEDDGEAWRAAREVLDAVAPLIAARVRAEVAEEIAQTIEHADRHVDVTAADMARTARAHATTEEDRRAA